MNTHRISRLLIATGLSIGLTAGMAFAQTAGQDMKSAGHETKDAATDAGHATVKGTKKAAHATKKGRAKAADKPGDAAQAVGHDTKAVAKETGRRTANAGDALAGKPEKH
jgi:hypothetical protein